MEKIKFEGIGHAPVELDCKIEAVLLFAAVFDVEVEEIIEFEFKDVVPLEFSSRDNIIER